MEVVSTSNVIVVESNVKREGIADSSDWVTVYVKGPHTPNDSPHEVVVK